MNKTSLIYIHCFACMGTWLFANNLMSWGSCRLFAAQHLTVLSNKSDLIVLLCHQFENTTQAPDNKTLMTWTIFYVSFPTYFSYRKFYTFSLPCTLNGDVHMSWKIKGHFNWEMFQRTNENVFILEKECVTRCLLLLNMIGKN